MKNSQTINGLYQQIADISELMLKQAKDKNWPDLIMSGKKYNSLVKQTRKLPFSPTQIDQQQMLLSKALGNEAAVRDLIKPELTNLSRLMESNKSQRTAIKAYYDTAKPDIN